MATKPTKTVPPAKAPPKASAKAGTKSAQYHGTNDKPVTASGRGVIDPGCTGPQPAAKAATKKPAPSKTAASKSGTGNGSDRAAVMSRSVATSRNGKGNGNTGRPSNAELAKTSTSTQGGRWWVEGSPHPAEVSRSLHRMADELWSPDWSTEYDPDEPGAPRGQRPTASKAPAAKSKTPAIKKTAAR
jgi:hypothetical protein